MIISCPLLICLVVYQCNAVQCNAMIELIYFLLLSHMDYNSVCWLDRMAQERMGSCILYCLRRISSEQKDENERETTTVFRRTIKSEQFQLSQSHLRNDIYKYALLLCSALSVRLSTVSMSDPQSQSN